ncbi:MAG: branched-chain amino acid ABC transporter permease [Anaerolineales bacterium]
MARDDRSPILASFRLGLVAGVAAVLISLIGLVVAFDKRDILAGVISLGQTWLVCIMGMAGYLAAQRAPAGPSRLRLAHGAFTGAMPGFMLGLLIALGRAVNLRVVLVNASPTLYEVLSFGLPTAPATLLLTLAGAALGLAGGAMTLLPPPLRRRVFLGLAAVAFVGLLHDLIRVTLTNLRIPSFVYGWMFGRGGLKGLSLPGATLVFALTYGGRLWRERRASGPARRPASRRARYLILAATAIGILLVPRVLGQYMSEVLNQVGLFILMGLGLNIVVGFAGLLDLGYVAFFAIGAYTVGVLTSLGGEIAFGPQVGFWPAVVMGVLVSILFGVILGVPVLKMRGDYLAIVTLGFGEIIRIMALSDFLKPYIGGSQGIVTIPPITIGPWVNFKPPQMLFYVILAGCLLAAFVAYRLKDSRLGRAWMAMREDEDVAQAMGLNLVSTKLLAFATGAAFSGLGGAIFASKLGTIYPHSFQLLVSINVLSLIIVGGMGSIPGVIVGAFALVGLPELLREFAEYRLLVYGAVLIAMMLLRPEGLLPEEAHRRELHEAPELAPEAVPEPGGASGETTVADKVR